MKVAHIIPSTFDYFSDIKTAAFSIAEQLDNYDIESNIITLQYQTSEQSQKEEEKEISGPKGPAPSYSFKGLKSMGQAIDELSEYDLVHLHCPFLSAAGKILKWKQDNPNIPLLITYYREVIIKDLISIYITFYNKYYLSKIFKSAGAITCFSEKIARKLNRGKMDDEKIFNIAVEEEDMREEENLIVVHLTNGRSKVKLEYVVSMDRLVYLYGVLLGVEGK